MDSTVYQDGMYALRFGEYPSAGGGAAPFSPDDIASIELWLKADDGPNPSIDGLSITSWADKSGNARTLFTDAGTPVYRASLGPNSLPCVEFDGVSEYMSDSGWTVTDASGVHIFFVFEQITWTSNDSFYAKQTAGLSGLFYQSNGANNVRMFSGSVGPQTSGALPGLTTWYHSEQQWNGASSLLYIDGTSFGPANPGATTFAGFVLGARAGGANPANFRVAEVIMYSEILTGTNLSNVRAYINAKYGLTTP
jgi:hypothetical protein